MKFLFFLKSNNKWNYSGQKCHFALFIIIFGALCLCCLLLLFLHRFYKLHDQFLLTFPIWRFKKDHTNVTFGRSRYWCWWYFLPEVKACFSYFFKQKNLVKNKDFFSSWFELLLLLQIFLFFIFISNFNVLFRKLVYEFITQNFENLANFLFIQKNLIALFTWLLSMINLTNFEIYGTRRQYLIVKVTSYIHCWKKSSSNNVVFLKNKI